MKFYVGGLLLARIEFLNVDLCIGYGRECMGGMKIECLDVKNKRVK